MVEEDGEVCGHKVFEDTTPHGLLLPATMQQLHMRKLPLKDAFRGASEIQSSQSIVHFLQNTNNRFAQDTIRCIKMTYEV